GMHAAFARHGVSGATNQVGPVVQCVLGVERCTTFAEFMAADQGFYDRLTVEMLRRGLFTLPGGRWYISTAHTDEDIATTVEVFDESLGATLATGPAPRSASQPALTA